MSSARKAVCAVALVALWVGMPLAGIVHASMEAHSYCAEHQTLEHERDSSVAHEKAPSRAAVSRHDGAGTPHESCFFAEDGVRDADVAAASQPTDSMTTPTGPLLAVSQRTTSPIAVLRNAPKSSPPSRRR